MMTFENDDAERSHTHARHKMLDDVPEHVKMRRLQELVKVFREGAERASSRLLGTSQVVLVEGYSRRSTEEAPQLSGRTDGNRKCVFPANAPVTCARSGAVVKIAKGDYVRVLVTHAGPATLQVQPLERLEMP